LQDLNRQRGILLLERRASAKLQMKESSGGKNAVKLNQFEGALKKIKCGIENGKLDNEKILAIIESVFENNP
jgi:hypothetical protein